jgi:hypothetical protein
VGPLTVPTAPFVVYATGADAAGNPFQRAFSTTIAPQSLTVTAPPTQDLGVGKTTIYTFQLKNLGAADTFVVSASDDRHFLSGVSSSFFTLGTGGSASVDVQLTVPVGTTTGELDTLTVSVQGSLGARNFAVVRSNVGVVNQPPDCSAAAPSVARILSHGSALTPVSIVGVTDPDGDPVSITVTSIFQDEATDQHGHGDTCPDAAGIGTSTAQVRAEQDGGGDGRVYSISFSASDGRGGTCASVVKVCVPKDAQSSCVDEGPLFDSMVCRSKK